MPTCFQVPQFEECQRIDIQEGLWESWQAENCIDWQLSRWAGNWGLSAVSWIIFLSTLVMMILYYCRFWENTASFVLKILYMKSWQLDLILRRQTIFFGHSNSKHLLVAWRRREITMWKVEMLETGKTTSMNLSEEWTN